MRALVLAACCVALGHAEPQQLVTMDVTVDADGQPAPGLTAADFEVRLNGRALPIRAAAYVRATERMTGAVGPSFDAAPLPPGAAASGSFYRLTIELPAGTTSESAAALDARVIGRSNVKARVGTMSPAPSAPAPAIVPPGEQIRRAIASGRALNGIGVSLERSVRRASDPSKVAIDVAIVVSPAAQAPLSTTFGLVDASGAIRTSDKTIDAPGAGGYRLSFSVPVAPGAYTLRFAAADRTGAVGSIESPVDATLAAMGPFQASGIAIEPLPGARRGILASLELYPSAAAPSDVIVTMALVSGTDPVNERAIVPELVDGVLRADAEFTLDALPPGTYSLRAVVVSGATVLGTISRPLPR